MIKIPYAIMPPHLVEAYSDSFMGVAEMVNPVFQYLQLQLKQARIHVSATRYLSMCFFNDVIFAFFVFLISFMTLGSVGLDHPGLPSLLITVVALIFVFSQQL